MEFISLGILGLLIVISPGADFVLVFKNSLSQGRKAGVLTAIGIASGVCIHVGYSIIGIGHFISQNDLLFNLVKYGGAAYLIYLGLSGILQAKFDLTKESLKNPNVTSGNYFVQGFLCNLLNPKTMLFFLSIFSQLVTSENSGSFIISYGLYMVLLHGLWFFLVAMLVTSDYLLKYLQRFSQQINRACGAGLIVFGTLLSFSS
ncbi:MAG: LysE family transporter [Gammaproteobacteria bacterium]|nr:LysE family transporter [Gammaproteobacteria bacterium]